MDVKKKKPIILFSLFLILMVGVAGVYAYLTDITDTKTNVFTVGKVEITLDETDVDDSTPNKDRDNSNTYKIIPGVTFDKDPMVTVKAGSADCWVFVEVIDEEKTYNGNVYKSSDFLTYSITTVSDGVSKWNELEDNVYYCKMTDVETDTTLTILDGNKVIAKNTVTKEMLNDIANEEYSPKLEFKAYAIQIYKSDIDDDGDVEEFTAAEAWAQLNS